MDTDGTLLLARGDVNDLLSLEECMEAVETAFGLHAEGKTQEPKILGLHTHSGGFHIKAGVMQLEKNYFVAKINSNFSNNKRFALPLIQGVIAVYDGDNGQLLALMDSIEITIIRTGAATGVATKYLAKQNARTITICGCGNQGRVSLKAIMKVRKPEKVFAFDIDKGRTISYAKQLADELAIAVLPATDLNEAVKQSDICVTCTTSTRPFITLPDVSPGIFIAAVGADSEHKQEVCPELISSCKLVADLKEQCATIGELHHALEAKLMTVDDVYAELGEIIAGKKKGRTSDDEIIVFDSTGIALQDVAAAAIVYERALKNGIGMRLNFAKQKKSETEIIKKNQQAIAALSCFFPFR